jgi:hypothetical protein
MTMTRGGENMYDLEWRYARHASGACADGIDAECPGCENEALGERPVLFGVDYSRQA